MKPSFLFIAILLVLSCEDREPLEIGRGPSYKGNLIKKAWSLKTRQVDSAIFFTKEAASHAIELSDTEMVAQCNLILGELFYIKGYFEKSNESLTKALSFFSEAESESLGKTYNLLGRVYQHTQQPALALNHYKAAMRIYKKINQQGGLAATYGNVGHFHEKAGQYDSALFYQTKAREIYLQLDDKVGLARIYDNLGSIYEDKENYQAAKRNFESAYFINNELGNEVEAIINLNNLGDISRKTGSLEEALSFTRQALAMSKSLGHKYQMGSAYKDLSKIYQVRGLHDLAYQYLDSSYSINSEIYSEEIAREIASTRAIYEVEQKEQHIELLEKDKEISQVNRNALLGATLLIAIIGGLVFLQLHTRMKKNKKIYEVEKGLTKANEERLQTALDYKKLQEEKLQAELEIRSRELTTNALHIIRKNEFLDEVKKQLKTIKKSDDEVLNKKLKKIIRSIDYNFTLDDDWQEFESIFQQVHAVFFDQLRSEFPDLTSAEIRLCAMLRLNLHSNDIATIMGISQDSLRISRYRLRKKLGIEKGGNLYSFIMNIG